MNKPLTVILAGPLPPPIAGPELVTETLLQEGPRHNIKYIHMDLTAASNGSRARWSFFSVMRGITQASHLAWLAWKSRNGTRILHMPLSQSTTGVLRDLTLIGIARAFGLRIVLQFHGGDFRQFWLRCRYQGVVSRSLAQVDKLLVFDPVMKSQFPFVPANRIAVLVNPVPGAWVRAWPQLPARNPERGPLQILYVSHISVAKGFLDLIQALSELPGAKDWELHVAGDRIDFERNIVWTGMNMNQGWARSLKILSQAHLTDRVMFHGVITGAEKERLFHRGHVLVLPSYSEGLPIVMLEAMYAGLAVIGTHVGAVPNLLDPSCLIRPGDTKALVQKLSDLDSVRCRLLGEDNRRRVEQGYLPSQVMAHLRTIYEELSMQHPPINLADRKPGHASLKTRGPT